MRRPHPYLVLSLVCAAVVLATAAMLACPARAEVRVIPTGPREPVADLDTVPVVNGWPIMPGSPQCARTGPVSYVPDADRVRQIRGSVVTLMNWDVETGYLTTTRTPAERAIAFAMVREIEPRFRDRPTWVAGAVPPGYTANCTDGNGVPALCVCAAGIGYLSPVVDAGDPAQVEKLLAWETVNSILYLLNRPDLGDSSYVTRCLSMIAPVIGGWRTE